MMNDIRAKYAEAWEMVKQQLQDDITPNKNYRTATLHYVIPSCGQTTETLSYYAATADQLHPRCAFDGSYNSGTGCRAHSPHSSKSNVLAHDGHVAGASMDDMNGWHIPKVKKVDNMKQIVSTYLRVMFDPGNPATAYKF